MVLLSTLHKAAAISDQGERKPAIILDYNFNKGGMDNLDKVIGTYSCRSMTACWPLVIFHTIFNVSSYNAFVLWNKINPTWMPDKLNKGRVSAAGEVGKALVTPYILRREHLPHTAASAEVVKVAQVVGSATALAPAGAKRGRDVSSAHQRGTIKRILCPTNVRNISAKIHAHTVAYCLLHVLTCPHKVLRLCVFDGGMC